MVWVDDLWKINFSCSGQIAKTWIYKRIQGAKLKFAYIIPNNPKEPDQQVRRSLFHCAVRWWGYKTPAEKEVWNEKIRQRWRRMSGYNLWISYYIAQGIEMAVKQVIHGQPSLEEGTHDIIIPEVDKARSILLYSSSILGDKPDFTKVWGVEHAFLLNNTTIRVVVWANENYPNVTFCYQVVEFV